MTNKPVTTLRDGTLSATLWKNNSEAGRSYYAVQFNRRYQDATGAWQDSDRFTGSELLRLAHLATQAYTATNAFRDLDREEASPEPRPAEAQPNAGRQS